MITLLTTVVDWYMNVPRNTVSDAVFQCLASKGHPEVAGVLGHVPYAEIVQCVSQGAGF